MTSTDISNAVASLVAHIQREPAKVALIVGPTAIGKSGIALTVAKQLGGEIISMDSCSVYKELDIGSAKPTPAQREEVPHHLLDHVAADDCYSVGQFFADAQRLVTEIRGRKKVPIIVGGTMLYANVLLNGMAAIPTISADVRKQARELVANDLAQAYGQLQQHDPEFAAQIHANDTQRITRGLEVFFETSRTLSSWIKTSNQLPDFSPQLFSLFPQDRALLRQRLDVRVDAMLAAGFVDEVRALVDKYGPQIHSLRSVGYKQLVPYVLGEVAESVAIAAAKKASRRLARYQLSWVRRFNPPTEASYWL